MTTPVSAAPTFQTSNRVYYTVAICIGLFTGLVGSLFHALIDDTLGFVSHVPHWLGLEGPIAYVVLAVVSAVMFCAAVALVRGIAPEASGSGVQEIEGAMAGLRTVRWKQVLPVKFIGGVLALGAGMLGGREGPTIHIGASIAQGFSQRFVHGVKEGRALLGAGAAAGLTVAFNAPVASVLFIMEEARAVFPYTKRAYVAVIIACAASAVVTVALTGYTPFMAMAAKQMPVDFLPVFIVLGIILGAIGVLFNRAIIVGLDFSATVAHRVSPYLLPALLGLIIGPMLLLFPQATGGGDSLVVVLVNNPLPLALLGLVVLARFFLTAASYSVGTPAGIFAPILALSTAISLFLGQLLAFVMPLPADAMVAFAVAGMAGLFASTVRSPLVGVVLVAELTGTYSLALPTLLTAVTSTVVAAYLGGRPIYDVLLERTLRLAGQPPAPTQEL